MQLTNSQTKALNEIYDYYYEIRVNNFKNEEKNVYFKAPTGSGKTFIASKLIEKILSFESFNKKNKTIIIIATISNADLPKQFTNKLKEYQKYNNFKNYQIEHIQSPSTSKSNKREDFKDFVLQNNKVFICGTSSFGRNTLFYQNNVLENLVTECKLKNYDLIFIRDEAHIGSKEKIGKNELKKFDNYMQANAKFILKMTATPPLHNNKFVEISLESLRDDDKQLLKNSLKQPTFNEEVTEEKILDSALTKFKKIKKEYQDLDINPAILIQINNDSNNDPVKKENFQKGLKLIEQKLLDYNLAYLKYLDKKEVINTKCPATLEYVSQNNSLIDAIIFKIGPATGWDIPRANMLIQLRSVSSEILNVQTIGRIKRNPYPNLEYNFTTDKYYLYSNYQESTRYTKYYKLKKEFKNKVFYKGKINFNSNDYKEDIQKYQRNVRSFIKSNHFKNKVKDINIEKDLIMSKTIVNKSPFVTYIDNFIYLKIYNTEKYNEYKQSLHLENFEEDLKYIAQKCNCNLEIVKYLFINSYFKIIELKNLNTTWYNNLNSYSLKYNARLKSRYEIWSSKQKPITVLFKEFKNYGYVQITKNEFEKYTQHLDSNPEKQFMDQIKDNKYIWNLSNEITFYAKMPVFGSGIFFEYYSKQQAKIARSYIDFVIEIKTEKKVKLIMIEVKSHNNDYDEEKTKELKQAYKQYMKYYYDSKYNNYNYPQIILGVYSYDSKLNTNYVHYFDHVKNKWKEQEKSFREFFNVVSRL